MWSCNLWDIYSKNSDESQVLCCLIHHRLMRPFQNKSGWRSSWCSSKRTSWLGCRIACDGIQHYLMFSLSSAGVLLPIRVILLLNTNWFDVSVDLRITADIFYLVKKHLPLVKSQTRKEDTRGRFLHCPCRVQNPWYHLTSKGQQQDRKRYGRQGKGQWKSRPSIKPSVLYQVKIRFWLSRPLCGGEHSQQDRVCGTDKPCQLSPLEIVASGNHNTTTTTKSLNTDIYLPIKTCHIPALYLKLNLWSPFKPGWKELWAESCSSITKCLCWAEPICCKAFCCKAAVTSTSPPAQFCWCQFLCAAGSLYVVTHVEIIRKESINDWHSKLCLI